MNDRDDPNMARAGEIRDEQDDYGESDPERKMWKREAVVMLGDELYRDGWVD